MNKNQYEFPITNFILLEPNAVIMAPSDEHATDLTPPLDKGMGIAPARELYKI